MMIIAAVVGSGFWRLMAGLALALVFVVLLVGVVTLAALGGDGGNAWTQVQ